MEITYTLERDDYWQDNKFVLQRIPALRRQALLRFFVLPAIVLGDAWLLHLSQLLLLVAVAFCALWVCYMAWAPKRLLMKQVEARPDALGLHTMRLSAEDVSDQNLVMLTTVRWEKITDVAASPQRLGLFISPRYALFVPIRAFASPEQAQAF